MIRYRTILENARQLPVMLIGFLSLSQLAYKTIEAFNWPLAMKWHIVKCIQSILFLTWVPGIFLKKCCHDRSLGSRQISAVRLGQVR